LTVIDSSLRRNVAFGGGGIHADRANLTRSTVSGNISTGAGGGISGNTVTLTNSTVSGNIAEMEAGGISANTATLSNSTLSGNTAGLQGGGIWAVEGTLLNCTVVENIALTGGGLFHELGGAFNIRSSIVALNMSRQGGSNPDVSGIFASQGRNLIGDGTGSTGFSAGLSDLLGSTLDPIDPLLGPLDANGGPTMTHSLLAGSPAIDKGDNVNLPPTDQRGLPRRKDGNGDGVARVDIGAFER
jgi:hypothetical protein